MSIQCTGALPFLRLNADSSEMSINYCAIISPFEMALRQCMAYYNFSCLGPESFPNALIEG